MAEEKPNNLKARPPIVVVMGHVDHGKTTLLDYIRKSSYVHTASEGGEPRSVAEREAGGITQSIGAYEIVHYPKSDGIPRETRDDFSQGRKITFIDTPGHEAFTKMRSRGASAADLAILVVAADEGVKPQTMESIRILNETKTPYIVAITKIDKNNADLEKTKGDLTTAGVLLEGFGGSVSYQPVSSKSGEHVDELLDLILLAAELENLTYDPDAEGSGYIIETRVDKRRGLEATVIVKNGTLKQGDPIATASGKGKIKILEDFLGKTAKSLLPSSPALIIGLEELPLIGEEFVTGSKANIELAKRAEMEIALKTSSYPAVRDDKETLNLVLKAADSGSLEALYEIVNAMSSTKPIKIVDKTVGEVGDNDVKLAISTQSVVIAFRSKVDKGAKTIAEANRIQIITSDIIYELIKAIEEFLREGIGAQAKGELEVLAVFNKAKPEKQVVGGKVTKGIFRNKAVLEIERGGAILGRGRVTNVQEQKEDVHQVTEGKECGVMVNSPTMIEVGDKLIIRE